MDDGSNELGEKNSNESSPSPSDSSNNVDEIAYTAADLGIAFVPSISNLINSLFFHFRSKNIFHLSLIFHIL